MTPNLLIERLAGAPMDPFTLTALTLAALLLAAALRSWLRGTGRGARSGAGTEPVDTVQACAPEASRVLDMAELQALELARCAAPEALVLAQVPLARFLRAARRDAYGRWLARVGHLHADVLLCDARSRVVAVIDVPSPTRCARGHRRHARMLKVLRAAQIPVLVWRPGQMPSVGAARAQFAALGMPSGAALQATVARTISRAPESPRVQPRDLLDFLAEGDAVAARRPVVLAAERVMAEPLTAAAAASRLH